MTLTMNKNATRAITTAAAINAYYDELTEPEVDWTEIEATEMAIAEALDAALAAYFEGMADCRRQ